MKRIIVYRNAEAGSLNVSFNGNYYSFGSYYAFKVWVRTNKITDYIIA